MRISDCSSDECSSDLATEAEVPATPFHPPGGTSCPARATNPFWSNPMAVQKSRVSPSRRGQRRAHDSLTAKQLSTDPTSGETHLRHHVTADGYYRRSEEHTSELQSLMRLSYAVFCLNKKQHTKLNKKQ